MPSLNYATGITVGNTTPTTIILFNDIRGGGAMSLGIVLTTDEFIKVVTNRINLND